MSPSLGEENSMYLKPNTRSVAHHGQTVIGFNWIGGKELEGDLPSFDSRSPVDDRDIVGIFPECGARDIDKAVRAAADVFASWSEVPAPQRGALIGRIGSVLQANKEKLARVITREVGKTPKEALGEVQEAIDTCDFFQSEGRRLYGQTVPSELPGKSLYTYRRPVGVCGIITANNFPLAVPSWKIIPAILCGNTVVWKPSEDAPTTAYLFARCMMDAGLPAGVVNVVNGRGEGECGKHFLDGIENGCFQKFSFTGSTAVGRQISELCGRNLLIPSLELGGKNPLVVMPDCHLENAVRGAVWGAFGTAGQRCTSTANIILHRDIADEFKEQFLAAVAHLPIGNPISHPEVAYGPMINGRFAAGFEAHWKMGAQDGAKLLCGGARWDEENRDERVKGDIQRGIYMQPCVWDEVVPTMRLFQEEIFGPTVNLSTVNSFDEALEFANGTRYGLSGAIYSENRIWIERFKKEIKTGMVSINNATSGAEAHLPFGGNGWSGNGSRESGIWVIDWYTRWQAVNDDASGSLQLAQIETDYNRKTVYSETKWDAL